MAYGVAENPALSPTTHLDGIEYPVQREELAQLAADNGAPADVINLFRSLPSEEYKSREAILRDFAEAARRFAMGSPANQDDPLYDRRNIGRDLVEGGHPGHGHP